MGGAPGLGTSLGDGVPLGQVGQLLEGVLHVDDLGQAVADSGFEGVLDLMLDDENHRLKSCPAGVVDGIVDDELAVVAHGVDLLQTTVTASHTGGHNDQNRLIHIICSSPSYDGLGL